MQRRREIRSEEDYIRDGYELFVFHERSTGADCEVWARSLREARRNYRRILEKRERWLVENRRINAEAMRPFVERHRARMKEVYDGFVGSLFGESHEGCSSKPKRVRKRSREKNRLSDSVQLKLFKDS